MKRLMLPGNIALDLPDEMTPDQMTAVATSFLAERDAQKANGISYEEAQQRQLGKSWFPSLESGLSQAGLGMLSLGSRALRLGDQADALNRESDTIGRAADEVAKQDTIPDILQRGVRGVAASVPGTLVGGLAGGPAGAIVSGVVGETNRAMTEGEARGLSGDELHRYAAVKGGIEGAIAGAFQVAGLGGAENVFRAGAAKEVARQGFRQWAKQTLKDVGHELTEEELTEFSHVVADRVAIGDDASQITGEKLAQTFADTAVRTMMTMGLFKAGEAAVALPKKRLGKTRIPDAPHGPVADPGDETPVTATEPTPEPQVADTPPPPSQEYPPPPSAEEVVSNIPTEGQPNVPEQREGVILDGLRQKEGRLQGSAPSEVVDEIVTPPDAGGVMPPVSGQVGPGWKLHLSTANPEEVSRVLTSMGLKHKIGRASGQSGKDVTVYVGDKDTTDAVAAKLSQSLGSLLANPSGEVLDDDVELAPRVLGRFDAPGDPDFHQYGRAGIPYLSRDMDPWNKRPDDVARSEAEAKLIEKYGQLYTGTKRPPDLRALKPKEVESVWRELTGSTQRAPSKSEMIADIEAAQGVAPPPLAETAVPDTPLPPVDDVPPPPEPLYESAGEAGIVARVYPNDRGFAVVVEDTESGEQLPSVRVYKTLEEAQASADSVTAPAQVLPEPAPFELVDPDAAVKLRRDEGYGVEKGRDFLKDAISRRPLELKNPDEVAAWIRKGFGPRYYLRYTKSQGKTLEQAVDELLAPSVTPRQESPPATVAAVSQPPESTPASRWLSETVPVDESDSRFKDARREATGPGGYVHVVDQQHLAEVIGEPRPVFHETNLDNVRKVIQRLKAGNRRHSLFVSDDPTLAIGQGGKGYVIELDSTQVNGRRHQKPASGYLESVGAGGEFVVEKSLPTALVAVTVKNTKALDSLRNTPGFDKILSFDSATPTERGIRIPSRSSVTPRPETPQNAPESTITPPAPETEAIPQTATETTPEPEVVAEPDAKTPPAKKRLGKPKPAPQPEPEPVQQPATRRTPAKGTPERETLDARAQQAEKDWDAASEAASKVKAEHQKAGYGTKRKEQLEKRREKADAASQKAWDEYQSARNDWLDARLEDAAESDDPVASTVAKLELDRKRLADIQDPGLKRQAQVLFDKMRADAEKVVGKHVQEAAHIASQIDVDGKGVLPAKEDAEAVQRAVDGLVNDLIANPLSAEKKLTDVLGGRIRGERLRAYQSRARKEIESIEGITPSESIAATKNIDSTYSFEPITEAVEKAKSDVASRIARQEAEEAAKTEVEKAFAKKRQFRRDLTSIKPKPLHPHAAWLAGHLVRESDRWAYLKTAQESGIATDGRWMLRMTEKDKAAAAKQPIQDGRSLSEERAADFMAPEKGKSYSPGKVIGVRELEDDGEMIRHSLIESESGVRLVVDSDYLHIIQYRYPDAAIEVPDKGGGRLLFRKDGDVVAILLPLEKHKYTQLEGDTPPAPKKRAGTKAEQAKAATPPAEPAPSALDAMVSPELQDIQSLGAARRRVKSAEDLVGDYDEGDTTASPYASPNKELERRLQASKKGVTRKKIGEKMRAATEMLAKVTVRGSLPELPRTRALGEARAALHQFQHAPAYGVFAADDLISKTVKPLNDNDFDLFIRAVIFRNLAETDGAKPYGLDDTSAAEELARIEKHVAENPKVQAALDYREMWNKAMVDDYIAAHQELGIDYSKRFNRENYYRHQVLFYYAAHEQLQKARLGQKKAELNTNRGWMKNRKGSDLDINANYIQAEWEVATQMIADTKRAQAVAQIQRTYDKLRALKDTAKENNYVAVVGGRENYNRLRELRQMIDDSEGADASELKDIKKEIWDLDPTMPYRQQIAIRSKQLEKQVPELADAESLSDRDRLMKWITKNPDSPGNSAAKALYAAVTAREEFIKKTLGDKYQTWEDLIPDDYEAVQIRPGRAMFQAYSLPEAQAAKLLEGLVEKLNISKEDLVPIMALGGEFTPIVVPREIAAQMGRMSEEVHPGGLVGELDKGWTKLNAKLKRFMLMGPTRVLKYNLRNLSEVDKVMSLNPQALRRVPQATKDLYALYSGSGDVPANVRQWVELGGAGTLVRVNELGDLNDIKKFARLMEEKTGLRGLPEAVWRKYWDTVEVGSDFRESILRYAAYLEYLDQIKTKGKPNNYGGSVRQEVEGIIGAEKKAFRLSADLLGDYSDISVLGQLLRNRVWPFWSFQETNARTYIRGLINLASDDQIAMRAGGAIAKSAHITGRLAPAMAMKLGRIGILYFGAKALLTAWNEFAMWAAGDDDDDVPDDVKRGAWLYLGRDSEGNIRYFGRLGTSTDFLDWFGFDSIDSDVKDVLDGRRTLGEVAKDYAWSPVNKSVNSLSPFIKGAIELPYGVTAYPDVRKPRQIRDRGEYLARILGLQNEYNELMGKPSRGYLKSLASTAVYKAEPGAAHYYLTQDAKFRWMKRELGRTPGQGSDSKQRDALLSYKQALRMKDKDAADRYLAVYRGLGGTEKGVQQSLNALHPLSGLNPSDEMRFRLSLSPTAQDELERAEKFYYEKLLTPEQAVKARESRAKRLENAAQSVATLQRMSTNEDEQEDFAKDREVMLKWFKANRQQPDVKAAIQAVLKSKPYTGLLMGERMPTQSKDMPRYQQRRQAAIQFRDEFSPSE